MIVQRTGLLMAQLTYRAAHVAPGGGTYPSAWNVDAPLWGVKEWIFHSAFDDGTLNTQLTLNGVNGKVLDDMRAASINGVPQNYKVRILRDPNWEEYSKTPDQFAKQLSDDVKNLNQDKKQCSLAIDAERHDGDYIYKALKEIRRLRPGRGVFWTMEPHQGGWIKDHPELVNLINNDSFIFVVAQTYDKNMNPWGHSDDNRVDLWNVGIKREKVEVYYGLKEKPAKDTWSGALYDWNNFIHYV